MCTVSGTPEMGWHLLSAGNTELSHRLSNFQSNISTSEDYVNHWAFSHVKVQLYMLQVLYYVLFMCKVFIKTTETGKTFKWNRTSNLRFLDILENWITSFRILAAFIYFFSCSSFSTICSVYTVIWYEEWLHVM